MFEVQDKRKRLRHFDHDERQAYLRDHPIPAVLGPEGGLYITDHHHLGRALHDEEIEHGFFLVEADYSKLENQDFWLRMAARKWAHPVDPGGQRCSLQLIPKHLKALLDDPYRSLAGYVREAGGYEKTPTAFAEFTWADFFRSQIELDGTREQFDAAVIKAVRLAQTPAARGLPGFMPYYNRR
jgi:hypothetical protein